MACWMMTSSAAALGFGALIPYLPVAQSSQGKGSDTTAPKLAGTFASPVRVLAGNEFMGVGRHYPSPVFQDMNSDGLADIVIGDLPGRITIALRLAGDGPPTWGPETQLKASDGKALKFSNW